MTTRLNPYISFRGDARAAMDFYRSVFGGDLEIMTFGDMPGEMPGVDPGEKDLFMHSMLTTPSGFTIMGADTPASMPLTTGDAMSVSLSGDDEAELTGYWNLLSDGATVTAPLMKAPWGDTFGMCTDKFGVGWLVNISGAPTA